MRRKILDNALRSESACLSAVFKGDTCDASLLQLLDLRFMTAEDPHYLATLEVTERDLRRGSVMLRYSAPDAFGPPVTARSEEHTSELQSLMRISYAVFCLQNNSYTKLQQLYTCRNDRDNCN